MENYVKLSENYFLIRQMIKDEKTTTVQVTKKVNHLFIVDVSGSMSGDLPLIRTQLKNKLSNVINEGDTISIIWFSGKNDCGILKEEVEVKSLKTLTDLHSAIDKWLKPVGLTAFCKPLELAGQVIKRIKVNRPDSIFSLIFLTDGHNNDCDFNSALKHLEFLSSDISSATFIEYGYYADSHRLSIMADKVGGEKISCDGFDEFEPVFNRKISTPLKGGKKVEVKINKSYMYDYAFAVSSDGSILTYSINDNKILVNPDINEIYYFSDNIGDSVTVFDDKVLYAAIYVLSDKLMNDDAEKIFYILGDQYYYNQLLGAFGKQKLNAFKNEIKDCVIDVTKRFKSGKVNIQAVDDNAFCLMTLINELSSTENCYFYPSHPLFKYNRIGRKRVQKGSSLSDEDKQKLAEASTVAEAQQLLNELSEKNVDIKFVANNFTQGYPLNDMVWNEERANLSIRIKIDGKVMLPNNKFGLTEVPTSKYQTFTIIKDGIVNVSHLPVSYSLKLYKTFENNNVSWEHDHWVPDIEVMIINLNSLPIINRSMIKSISANDLAKQEWELLKLQGEKKVYDYFRTSLFPKESKSFVELYGQEAADWLKEIGVTDYNGFNPKTEAEESTDFYYSTNLITKVKGISSLPKVVDVENKIKDGSSLKVSEWLLSGAINEYNSQMNTPIFLSLNDDQKTEVLKNYIISKSNVLNTKKRQIMQKIAEIKFALILSKKWFKEFKSFDENQLDLNLDGFDVHFTFDMVEKEVKI